MKLLIVSDIHANLEALQAVLAESHDELWVLGDLVNYGPNPSEVVDLVRRNASVVVQGNQPAVRRERSSDGRASLAWQAEACPTYASQQPYSHLPLRRWRVCCILWLGGGVRLTAASKRPMTPIAGLL